MDRLGGAAGEKSQCREEWLEIGERKRGRRWRRLPKHPPKIEKEVGKSRRVKR